MLQSSQPTVWMEPDLREFLQSAESYLVTGVHAEELAEWLKLDLTKTIAILTSLCHLGLIKVVDNAVSTPGPLRCSSKLLQKTTSSIWQPRFPT